VTRLRREPTVKNATAVNTTERGNSGSSPSAYGTSGVPPAMTNPRRCYRSPVDDFCEVLPRVVDVVTEETFDHPSLDGTEGGRRYSLTGATPDEPTRRGDDSTTVSRRPIVGRRRADA
jgi:hypothetical protein